jgi:hypothetical protein
MLKQIRKNNSTIAIARAVVVSALIGILPLANIMQANAAPITGRTIALSSSAGDASGVSYTLTTSALPTTTAVKSVELKIYDTLTGPSVPVGFSASSSTLASQPTGLGATSGWTVDATSAGALRIINGSNSTASSGALSITWNGVHNPTAANTTFYAVISTYSNVGFTGLIDTGSVAMSTSSQIQVAMTVGEALTFCAGTSITAQDCSTISGNTVNLGAGSTVATAKGTSVLGASTNGNGGYTISVNGSTLTSGSDTITALASGGVSTTNTKQFGLNLAGANTTPVVGAAKSGSGTAAASTNYGTNNTFRFATGEPVATVAGPTNANTFTVSYIANIDGLTPAGVYASNLTYIATANF